MTPTPDTIQVVIPALDEEETVGTVLGRLQALGLTRLRVVDNGSRDRTAEVARRAGAEVVPEPRRGYGAACWTGCLGLPAAVQWILFTDADGSDQPEAIPLLVAAAAQADLVLGDRGARPENRPYFSPAQHFGNGLATGAVRLLWGRRFGDLGPQRLIRRRLYEDIGMRDRGFGWTLEMQVRALELGARVVEVPVPYGRRLAGRQKITGTLRGSLRASSVIAGTLLALGLRQMGRRLRGRPCSAGTR